MYNNSLDWRRFSSGTRNFVLEGMWVCPFPSERANQRRYHTIIIFMALQKIAQPQPVSHFNTEILLLCFSSVQLLSHIRLFATPWLQHNRLPCPSPTPRACSSSCPSSQWYYPTISFSVNPLLLLPSIFPSIRVFSSESSPHIKRQKHWNFSFSISPSSE